MFSENKVFHDPSITWPYNNFGTIKQIKFRQIVTATMTATKMSKYKLATFSSQCREEAFPNFRKWYKQDGMHIEQILWCPEVVTVSVPSIGTGGGEVNPQWTVVSWLRPRPLPTTNDQYTDLDMISEHHKIVYPLFYHHKLYRKSLQDSHNFMFFHLVNGSFYKGFSEAFY